MNSVKETLQENFKGKRVLQYVREPKLGGLQFRKFGQYIAEKYLGNPVLEYISQTDRNANYFIDLTSSSFYDFTYDDFKAFEEIIDLKKVIQNDRVFRYEMPYIESLEYIFSCTKYFLDFFDKNRFDLLITHMVDEFIVDILIRVADYLKIPVISFCGSSFGFEYIRITKRGETNIVWDPTDEQIEKFYNYLSQSTSKPLVKNEMQVMKNTWKYYFIYKAKLLYHYTIQYKLMGIDNYRFMMTKAQTYPKKLSYIFGIEKYFQSISEISRLDTRFTVYIPLHYHPEATTDYWIENQNYLTYYPSLIKVIKYYSENGFNIVVKEHTASFKQRDPLILRKIKEIPGVILLNPFVSTYEAFQLADYVVVWTGTTGVEAIMQNKKVLLAEGETYYSLGELTSVGNEKEASFPSEKFKRRVAKHVLEGLLPYNPNV